MNDCKGGHMTQTKQNKMGSVVAGIAGVAVGAGATIAAITLSKKENRQKIKAALKDVQERGKQISEKAAQSIQEVGDHAKDIQKEGAALAKDMRKEAEKILD